MARHQKDFEPLSPMQSRKFLLYLISELTSKILLGAGLFYMKDQLHEGSVWFWWWMITLTICVTFLEVGAILGIAYVDRFVKVARIANQGPGKLPTGNPSDQEPGKAPPDNSALTTLP